LLSTHPLLPLSARERFSVLVTTPSVLIAMILVPL